MDTNKMREEFIRAYRVLLIKTDMNVQRRHFEIQDGEFVDRQTAIAWWAWQASREAVVVELPPKISAHNTTEGGFVRPEAEHYDEAIDDCREAIEAQGLKVAP